MVVVTVRVVYIYVNVIFSKDNNKKLLKKAYQGARDADVVQLVEQWEEDASATRALLM